MDKYDEKLKQERRWYTHPNFRANHFLNTRLLYSPERNQFNYRFPKNQLTKIISKSIKLSRLNLPKILIAPLGTGDDIKYIQHLSNDISGIDISTEAINRINLKGINKYIGDMKNMSMFPDNSFDIVMVPLFFHHFLDFGFDAFLKEIYRILKPDGYFFSLEPSLLHPVSWLTRSAKRVFGNITGQVEDEAPFLPQKLSKAMRRSGFYNIHIYGASFSHNRVPIWMAKINNMITYPFLYCPLVKYFAWMCIYYGRK